MGLLDGSNVDGNVGDNVDGSVGNAAAMWVAMCVEWMAMWTAWMAAVQQQAAKLGSDRLGNPTAAKYTHTGGRRRVSGFESKTSPLHICQASCRGHNIYDFQIKSSVTLVSEI